MELASEGGREECANAANLFCTSPIPYLRSLYSFSTRMPFLSIEMLHAFQALLKCLLLPKAFPSFPAEITFSFTL